MTNAMCAGEQDRNNTTSDTSPNIPPSKTKYCYLEGEFNRSDCGTSGEKACSGKGGIPACIPDNYGGYCKDTDKQIYIALGKTYVPLRADQLIDRYKNVNNTDEVNRAVKRALNEQKQKYHNQLSHSKILGNNNKDNKDNKNNNDNNDDKDNEVHGFVSDLFVKIGIAFSAIMFLIALAVLMVQNKII